MVSILPAKLKSKDKDMLSVRWCAFGSLPLGVIEVP